mmetsp:Transcript_13731/g.25287  ORF Transcript_13731/g.25287 Transcript_13731/m.25287 type:complete len:260 (-) Transcript_13731:343-1122(-)
MCRLHSSSKALSWRLWSLVSPGCCSSMITTLPKPGRSPSPPRSEFLRCSGRMGMVWRQLYRRARKVRLGRVRLARGRSRPLRSSEGQGCSQFLAISSTLKSSRVSCSATCFNSRSTLSSIASLCTAGRGGSAPRASMSRRHASSIFSSSAVTRICLSWAGMSLVLFLREPRMAWSIMLVDLASIFPPPPPDEDDAALDFFPRVPPPPPSSSSERSNSPSGRSLNCWRSASYSLRMSSWSSSESMKLASAAFATTSSPLS